MNIDEAFVERLIEAHLPTLRAYVRLRIPDPDVDDILQEVWMAVVAGSRPSDAPPDATAVAWRRWLLRVARNKCLDVYRRRMPAGAEPFDSARHGVTSSGTSLSSRIDNRHRVLAALRALPIDVMDVLVLRHCQRLTIEEIAEHVERSPATVKRWLAKGESEFRAAVGDPAALRSALDAL
ncbi:MAG: sigma-70 family RNA polymerase sigma factor [Myxococcales bacterium]|nr:sigma-70 family RNA polymerase sigma factor [Myxococcales bacterium]